MKKANITFLGVLALAIGLVMVLLGAHSWVDGWFEFQSRRWAAIFGTGIVLGFLGVAALTYTKKASKFSKEDYQLPLIATSIVLVLTVGLSEIVLRIVSVADPLGTRVGSVILRPFDWDAFLKHNRGLYERSKNSSSFYVGESELGWAIGPSRTSSDGKYYSSLRGLRSEVQGQDLLNAAHSVRLALYGDSFMFSEEVGYTDSLQHFLEEHLPPNGQTVTFGVSGYGIDQAVRSFELSSELWQPDVVVLAFIRDDFRRALNVHASLKVAWGIPFSKPRYIEEPKQLRLLNSPTFGVDEMLKLTRASELPYLAHEEEFFEHDWNGGLLFRSYFLRTLYSVYPSWDEPTNVEDMTSLGARLVNRFLTQARSQNRHPLAVYIPSKSDFNTNNHGRVKEFLSEMATNQVEFFNSTDCLLAQTSQEELFVKGGTHYSRRGNRALAQCLIEELNLEITEDDYAEETRRK